MTEGGTAPILRGALAVLSFARASAYRLGAAKQADRAGKMEDGFALVAVLLVLSLLGVIGAEFAHSMRLEATAVRTFKEATVAKYLAEAAIAQATREIFSGSDYVTPADNGQLIFYTDTGQALPRLARKAVPLGAGHFSYRLTDEQARVNINLAPRPVLDRLLLGLGVEKADRDVILDSIADWRDPDEAHRVNGAESEDTYLKLPVPYRSRNANLTLTAELLQIKGVTAEIFYGANGKPGLRDFVTVSTLVPRVNINTAAPVVLGAFGLSTAETTDIGQARRDAVFRSTVSGRFGGRGFAVTSRTFRIEAEGSVDGRTLAWITAVVQKNLAPGRTTLTVREWDASGAPSTER